MDGLYVGIAAYYEIMMNFKSTEANLALRWISRTIPNGYVFSD